MQAVARIYLLIHSNKCKWTGKWILISSKTSKSSQQAGLLRLARLGKKDGTNAARDQNDCQTARILHGCVLAT